MNLVKKIVAIATVLTVLVGPGAAFGLTAEELQEQIDALLAQLAVLQQQLSELTGEPATGYTGIPAGFTFDKNLSMGMSDPDVVYLKIVLDAEVDHESWSGTDYFGSKTLTAVKAFQQKYISEISAFAGYTISGTGFVGTGTRAQLNALLGEVIPPEECTTDADCPAGYTCTAGTCVAIPVAGGLTVALSPVTPASTTIITDNSSNYVGQVLVPFTTVNFTAGSEGAVKVTTLKFTRTGIAADANLDNTYLYEGDAKLVEGGTISSKVVTFNDSTGIFTVPASGTKSITLKANLNYNVSAGKTIGFDLVAAGDITSDASAVTGTFPISGNLMSVANATDLGYLTLTAGSTPASSDVPVNAQDDYEVWRLTVQANNQDIDVEQIIFTEVGSILTDDLQNFELYVGGTVIGTAEMDANNQVIFDLSGSPYTITKGQSKILKLYADIVKGANKTFKFTIQYPTDVVAKDTNYGVYVASYTSGTWSIIQPDGNYKINAGDLSITKATDSPTGNVARNATSVTLAKYDFKATGEDIKVNNLSVTSDYSASAAATYGLNNGMIYLDGVQVGSTKDIAEYGQTATNFTFGTSFIVAAGTTSTVEIKADVKNQAGTTDSLAADATITIYLEAGTTNVQGQSSLTVLSRPATAKAANALTIKGGSLTFTTNASYGTQYTVKPSTGFKIGSFQMLAGSSEGVNVDSITVVLGDTEAADTENMLLKIGADQIGTTKVTTSTSNLFSVNVDLAASGAKVVDIYSDILSTATGTTVAVEVYGTGTTATTSASVTAYSSSSTLTLQTINISTAKLAVNIASDNPDDALVVGLTPDVTMAKYEFASTYEAFNVSEVKVYASSDQDRTAPRYSKPNFRDFLNVWISYPDSSGNTVTTSKRSTFVNGMIHFTGLNMYVPANSTAKLTIYADLNAVAATGYARTGDRPEVSLAYYKASSGSTASYERSTGIIWYEAGTNNVALTWVDAATGTGDSDATRIATYTYGAGTNALLLTASGTLTGYHGGELDIPARHLDLKPSDLTSVTWSAQTDDDNLYGPLFSIFVDCDLDGAFDGEIQYVTNTLSNKNQWETVTLDQSTIVDWWSNANVCGAAGSGVALSTFPDTDAKIIGFGFGQGYYSNHITASKLYYADKLVINTSTATYAVEDDMGALGTNYILYKSKPTVTLEGATSGSLVIGTNTLYSFRVAADTAGDISLKQIRFSVTATDASDISNFKLYKGLTDYTDKVTINSAIDEGGDDLKSNALSTNAADGDNDVYVVFTNEEVITGGTSQIYYLKAAAATTTAGDSVQTYIVSDAAPQGQSNAWDIGLGAAYATSLGNFVWSDRSYGSAHGTDSTSLDWINGYLIKTLGDSLMYVISRTI